MRVYTAVYTAVNGCTRPRTRDVYTARAQCVTTIFFAKDTFFLKRAATNPLHSKLECGRMPNLMVALPNIGGALCSTPQSLADAHN